MSTFDDAWDHATEQMKGITPDQLREPGLQAKTDQQIALMAELLGYASRSTAAAQRGDMSECAEQFGRMGKRLTELNRIEMVSLAGSPRAGSQRCGRHPVTDMRETRSELLERGVDIALILLLDEAGQIAPERKSAK